MKTFRCDHCRQPIYFENDRCLNCGHVLAYLPDIADMAALEPLPEQDGAWRSLAPSSGDTVYRLCGNYTAHAVCNWAVTVADDHALCRACRFTRVAPNVEIPGAIDAWRRLEIAKRRLVHSLIDLQLPLRDREQDAQSGLAFDFLADDPENRAPSVLTGHANGVITINVAEADDVEREKRRVSLHEPYRTLLGHFRHEVGHYYWDRLVGADDERLARFRALFGDERADYAAALEAHYAAGPPADWQERHVSSYSTSHPWEDWAETWAHYLHLVDTLQTADACGVTILHPDPPPSSVAAEGPGEPARTDPFDATILRWISLAVALNELTRSLGQSDGYPFVLKPVAVEKLRFVNEVVTKAAAAAV